MICQNRKTYYNNINSLNKMYIRKIISGGDDNIQKII